MTGFFLYILRSGPVHFDEHC